MSYETMRVHALINNAAKKLNYKWYAWNRVEGLKLWNPKQSSFESPNEEWASLSKILEHYSSDEFDKNSVLILEDYHPDLTEQQPSCIRRLRNIAFNPPKNRHLILGQPMQLLPIELQKEMQEMELPLPGVDDLISIHRMICKKFEVATDDPREKLLEAALGLTTMEAQIAFGKAADPKIAPKTGDSQP